MCLKFQNRYIMDHINERWNIHDDNKDKIVTWDEYLQTSYGAVGERALYFFLVHSFSAKAGEICLCNLMITIYQLIAISES